MEMKGEYRISANREIVWEALNDPAVLKACLEGCESFDKKSDTDFEAVVTTKVGPIKTRFACTIELSDIDPPNAYTILGKGNGGASGYAKGTVKVLLTEDEGTTALSYTVDASLKGKIGQMGSRVVDSVAKRLADIFFRNLTGIVDERTGAVSDVQPSTTKSHLFRNALYAVVAGLIIYGIIRLVF